MPPRKLKKASSGPARTAQQRAWATKALRKLTAAPYETLVVAKGREPTRLGVAYKRTALFPDSHERWASLVLERLAAEGGVTIDARGRGAPKLYSLKDLDVVQSFLDDHRLLSFLLWPGRSLDPRTLPTDTTPTDMTPTDVTEKAVRDHLSDMSAAEKKRRGDEIFAAQLYEDARVRGEERSRQLGAVAEDSAVGRDVVERGRQLVRALSLAAYLTQCGGDDLYSLAERFGVTPRTIRRDLDALAAAGVVIEGEFEGAAKSKTWTVSPGAAETLVRAGVAPAASATPSPTALAEAQLKLAMGAMEATAEVARAVAALQSRVDSFQHLFCEQMGIEEGESA